jgi:mRNA-degrading endonuclease RelE of RelBE toxin-antitoxin system
MTYRIELERSAAKELERLPAEAKEALLLLETDPQAGESLTGEFSGYRSLHFTLKGSGQYRAIYAFEGEVCTVHLIGPRENIYKHLRRRLP